MEKINGFTHGEWKWSFSTDELYSELEYNDNNPYGDMGCFYVKDGGHPKTIATFGDSETYYPTEGVEPKESDIQLITTAGTSATQLSKLGFDAVKVIEDMPIISQKILSGDFEGAQKDLACLKIDKEDL